MPTTTTEAPVSASLKYFTNADAHAWENTFKRTPDLTGLEQVIQKLMYTRVALLNKIDMLAKGHADVKALENLANEIRGEN